MATITKRDTLRAYARIGAMRRLEELRQEEATIRSAFPELFRGGRPAAAVANDNIGNASTGGRRPARYQMSAAQRKAVSERMRRYWAARRKAAKNG